MRKLEWIFLGVLSLALTGCSTLGPAVPLPEPKAYTRVAESDPNEVQLQIALRKFVPARRNGPAVWLVGVMHVGDPDYYHTLQHFLDNQTMVLYEGVNPSAHKHHIHDAEAAAKPPPPQTNTQAGYSMQTTLAHSLGLVFQLDAIDYDRDHFLNSDLSVDQIEKIIAGNGPSAAPGQAGASNAPFNTLLQIMDGSSFLGSLVKLGLEIVAASPNLQAMAKLTIIEAVGTLKGDLSDVQEMPPDWKQLIKVLIEARNQNLIADLKSELKKVPPSGSIAVFYGVGHMDDLEKRLTGQLGYRPVEDQWFTAISVNLRKSGVSPTEAQFMRSLIRSQVAQMRSH